jgi:membrane-associated phospholipid phosphatase
VVVVAILAATAFVLLTVLVATGSTQHLDVAARERFRPDDVWGRTQLRADVVVEGIKPRNIAPVLALVGLGTSLWRRSWRPALYALLIGFVAGTLALVTKLLLGRPNPHYEMDGVGGAFPSGHMVSVLVCLGGAVLVLRTGSRWWEWLAVTTVGLCMAVSLLLQAAHWLTDVVGGALLATAVLAAMSLSVLREPPPATRGARRRAVGTAR